MAALVLKMLEPEVNLEKLFGGPTGPRAPMWFERNDRWGESISLSSNQLVPMNLVGADVK